jgi:hypothetical protein
MYADHVPAISAAMRETPDNFCEACGARAVYGVQELLFELVV